MVNEATSNSLESIEQEPPSGASLESIKSLSQSNAQSANA